MKFVCLLAIAAFLFVPQVPAQTAPATQEPDAAKTVQSTPAPEPLTPEKRGDIFMARKMYREAIEQYQLCTQTHVILNKEGIAYHQLTELDTAKKYYEKAIKLNPKYPEAVNNLGTIHYAKKSYRRAVNQYKKALRLSPDSASVLSNLGTAYFARKNYKEALLAYQKALSLDPEVFEHRSSFGVLLQERSVEERAKFNYYVAKTYAQAGMLDRALLYIRKALESGFKDKQKFLEEPEFAGLKENAEFQQLMATEQRVL